MDDFPVTGSVSTEGWVDILCFYICFIFPAFFCLSEVQKKTNIFSFQGRKQHDFCYSHHETYIFNAKCHQLNVYDTEEQEQLVPWMFSLHFGARL